MKKSTTLKYAILVALFLPFILFLFVTIMTPVKQPVDVGLHKVTIHGSFSYDRTTWYPLDGSDMVMKKGSTVWIKGNFSKDVPTNEALWFMVENIGMKFSVHNDEVLAVQQSDSFPALLMSPGCGWYSLQTSQIERQDEVLMEISVYEEQSTEFIDRLLNQIYIGDGKGLYQLLLSKVDVFALISLFAILAGVVYMLEGTIYDIACMPEGKRIQLLGFYLFAGGLWSVTDCLYPYLSLLISPSWLYPFVDMSGILLFPITLTLIVHFFVHSPKLKKVMHMLAYGALLLAVSAILIVILGFYDLYQQKIWIGCIGLLLLFISFICVGIDLKKYKKGYMWLLLLAILPAIIVIFIECINGIVMFMPQRIIMRYGFSISVTVMISQLIAYAKAELETKKSIELMKEELIQSRIAIMLSQIQPHFLFNALESIGDLCTKNPTEAEDAITDFSLFLRGNLDSLASEKLIPFTKELEHTKYYLKLEKLRFGKRLCVKIETEVLDFYLPSLSLQPIVENAVRYGVTRRKRGGTITITTTQDDTHYIVCVKDDGVGFVKNIKKEEDGRTHIGLANVKNRLKIQCNGSLCIDSIPNEGTTVVIRIAKEKENELENNRCR